MKRLEQTWRWFGPDDPVPLSHVRQAGATGVVTALHSVPNGDTWQEDAIQARKDVIEAAGLRWAVVESVPVHDDIKRRSDAYPKLVSAYSQTLLNLGKAGIRTVCFNFMPVLDWTRTELARPMPDGSTALAYSRTKVAAFDLHILRRPGAEADHPEPVVIAADAWYRNATASDIDTLTRTILAGLPGSEIGYTLDGFRRMLATYDGIDADASRSNLIAFLNDITPTAEEAGVTLTLHPDDPPWPLFGLPRVVGTAADVRLLFDAVPSCAFTLCFCTGSFGADERNVVPAMASEFASRIGFAHLRNTRRDTDGFHEADHLDGDTNMAAVMKVLVEEQQKRTHPIPFRPDHGHSMLDDQEKTTNPGYGAIGRLRGLAELRGLETGILHSFRTLIFRP